MPPLQPEVLPGWAYTIHTARQISIKGPGHRRQTRKYSSYTSRFVFNAMTLDHSVPQTWFSPNPLSGNTNVFFLSFWLISNMHGWKDWLELISLMLTELRKYSLSYIHSIYPSLPPATCHSAAGRDHHSKAGKDTTKAGYEGKGRQAEHMKPEGG